jgi:hypothetical protein
MTPESQEFLATFVAESYYYWASVLMLLIHVGFLAYEGGAARSKNVLATGVNHRFGHSGRTACLLNKV